MTTHSSSLASPPSAAPSRVWFITGASRGIGALLTAALLARGDRVVATARNPDAVLTRHGADHPRLLALALDVTREGQARDAVAAAIAHFGQIDVLVNNAGYGLMGAIEEASADDVRRIFDTNVHGLLHVTRAVLPGMRARRSGHVLNLSSLAGYLSGPGFGIYCATKFAVEAITEAMHAELAPLGVRVTAVEPGYFRTDFLDATSLAVSPSVIADYEATSGAVRQVAGQINHAQPGDPARVPAALMALVDSASPPLRLPLGSDTLAAIRDKHERVDADVAAWAEVARSTDFAAA